MESPAFRSWSGVWGCVTARSQTMSKQQRPDVGDNDIARNAQYESNPRYGDPVQHFQWDAPLLVWWVIELCLICRDRWCLCYKLCLRCMIHKNPTFIVGMRKGDVCLSTLWQVKEIKSWQGSWADMSRWWGALSVSQFVTALICSWGHSVNAVSWRGISCLIVSANRQSLSFQVDRRDPRECLPMSLTQQTMGYGVSWHSPAKCIILYDNTNNAHANSVYIPLHPCGNVWITKHPVCWIGACCVNPVPASYHIWYSYLSKAIQQHLAPVAHANMKAQP